MRKSLLIILAVLICLEVFPQGEIDDIGKGLGKNERTFAIVFNSNGWGFNYRYAKRLDGYRKRLFDFDLIGVKHPKEIKSVNLLNEVQKKFVYGKINQFYTLRAGIGNQKEIFSRFDKGGISIRYFYSFGLSLGLLKPIYYEVAYYDPVLEYSRLRIEKYNFYTQHNEGSIWGKASFFEGINETVFEPGGFIKTGLNFDFSDNNDNIRSLETGIIIDIYSRKIPIMATKENNSVFLSLFVAYRFGKTHNKRLKNTG
ncbi:MAG: hypothetical protein A2W91_11960 [Bacteroidetes bacterium GWF2_38_335]|nr:MAG: hypothetical protein A2W91_11960 [Bacteroidetes bacterium GWF2_38_335]OFY76888.1 MAG: hypothetical protein A2281_00075 [Bacteroidetes bacterium RIFOXYA12_FULL_38_20]HBS86736.1 hypothetical protein [Bacteroidales bacterium]